MRCVSSKASRARIQLRFPANVLISPLWQRYRYGWASGQLGKVLVEKRECTSTNPDSNSGSRKSGKNWRSCSEVSMPLYTKVRAEREGK